MAFQYGIQQARKRFAIVNMSYGIAILEHMKPRLFINEIEIAIRRLGRRLGGAASIRAGPLPRALCSVVKCGEIATEAPSRPAAASRAMPKGLVPFCHVQ